jgi:polyisoprenoid-binding protein YceI
MRFFPRFPGWLAVLALWFGCASAFAAPVTYRFDPVHTQVWFSASHDGYSHPLGRLRVAEGWFVFDPDDWSAGRVDVILDMTSVDLGDGKWSEAVMSGQFLDAERWPRARFTSHGVEKTGADTGIVHGTLELHGERQPVDVAFTLNRVGNDPYTFRHKIGFSATASLDRFAFGMQRFKEVVGATVDLRLEIEGIRESDSVPSPADKDSK